MRKNLVNPEKVVEIGQLIQTMGSLFMTISSAQSFLPVVNAKMGGTGNKKQSQTPQQLQQLIQLLLGQEPSPGQRVQDFQEQVKEIRSLKEQIPKLLKQIQDMQSTMEQLIKLMQKQALNN